MIAYVVRGGKGERDRGEEKKEESEKSEGRRGAGYGQLCRQRMKNVNSFLNMTKQWQRQAAVFVVGCRRQGSRGRVKEAMKEK